MTNITTHSARWARLRTQGLVFLILSGLISTAWSQSQNVTSITLGWNPSTDPTVVGYVVYYGINSASLTTEIDVGTNTTVTISNLTPGLTYYFAIADYNEEGVQSAPTAEVSYTVPGALQMNPPSPSSGGLQSVSFLVAPSHWYEVQGSTDLQTWATLWQTAVETTNQWVQFTDPQSVTLPSRFYRIVTH